MDPTHTWHPGAVCVTPRWAARVDLLPDELLTSWIARAAVANGCDPGAFRAALWPQFRWDGSDWNRSASVERLRGLGREGGIDTPALRRSTLAPIASSIGGRPTSRHGTWPWITSLGLNGLATSSATAFCAACLKSDVRPFLRLQWRMAWHTVCPLHVQPLIDVCPHCRRPPHSDRCSIEGGGLGHCLWCYGWLAAVAHGLTANPACLALQALTDRAAMDDGIVYWGEHRSLPAWFALLTTHLKGAQSAMRTPWNPWGRALRALGIALPFRSRPRQLEHASVSERTRLLELVARLVSLSQEEFLALSRDAGLSRQNLDSSSLRADHPLQPVVAELPDRSMGAERRAPRRRRLPAPRSRTQVEWKMRQLLQSAPTVDDPECPDA